MEQEEIGEREQQESGKFSYGFQWFQQGTRSLGQITNQSTEASWKSHRDNRELNMGTVFKYPGEVGESKTWS